MDFNIQLNKKAFEKEIKIVTSVVGGIVVFNVSKALLKTYKSYKQTKQVKQLTKDVEELQEVVYELEERIHELEEQEIMIIDQQEVQE